MEVFLTPEQEEQLSSIAAYSGMDSAQLVREAALRVVKEELLFYDAVEREIRQADNGELIAHPDIITRIERIFST